MGSLDDNDSLTRLDGSLLHLKDVRSILLLVLCNLALSGELAALSDGDKRGAETESDDGTEEEATGVEADNDVWGGSGEPGVDVVDEMGDEFLEGLGVLEQGEDVEEGDSLGVSVWVRGARGYRRKTHLFGEAGVDTEEGLEVGDVGHGCLG